MVWTNPSKTESDFYSDKFKCEQDAANMYPSQPVSTALNTGYYRPTITNCSNDGFGNTNCISTPGGYTPPATITVDANKNNRAQAFSSCMNALSWRLENKNDVLAQGTPTPTTQEVATTSTTELSRSLTLTSTLSDGQKKEWVLRVAIINGCDGSAFIRLTKKEGPSEHYTARCPNGSLDISCKFTKMISSTCKRDSTFGLSPTVNK